VPKCVSAAACSYLPVSMCAKRLARACIKLGFPRAKPWAGGAGGAVAPCRRPRRAIARHTNKALFESKRGAITPCCHPRRANARYTNKALFESKRGAITPCRRPRRANVVPLPTQNARRAGEQRSASRLHNGRARVYYDGRRKTNDERPHVLPSSFVLRPSSLE
jgi:hypothetical protein